MTRPTLARCDHCKNATTVKFKMILHPDGLEETFFECDVCGHHYTCFVTDQQVRDWQKEARRLRETKKQAELLELQEKINNRMAILKRRIVGVADG